MSEYYELTSDSPERTAELAEALAEQLQAGDVITLEGDLGAGKTSFTKGLAKGLGVKRTVNSPTFTIIKEYQGRALPLYHMDVYRLEEGGEDMGLEEYFDGGGVCVVEWASMIGDELPEERLALNLFHVGETTRQIRLEPVGERYITLCKEFLRDERVGN
ncbi:tRNA (adenosine(37)-N6)-threonylcarbamoyltransferase complex ATPase subunit type 1 TsaE [Alteribacter keqinensis]|uniref:tRNA threonylcarbamoyladenosine biosynthesis protein TsaE n=1 Tax=Alteribacter keqinensis TaxID=2483800 RepID=A0A3M7TLS5_9BACI|nr:tRNA (adenosine(37)-N6)-threonylcarbamoyltransferase complex ATPase subunit type 1 TsaE [Alteribacter keqinensis]RNA66583.1 tRNA (adenosine(37)-N6)-threonylcarbamoyltransferase complex ATPase subunit type 1 TsaE [Alteribacter keqinensis]